MFRFLIRFFPRLVTHKQLLHAHGNIDDYSEKVQLFVLMEIFRRANRRKANT